MSAMLQNSLEYFLDQPGDVEWSDFLTALGESLSAQMSVADVRAFFSVLGQRMARSHPIQADTVEAMQAAVNVYFADRGWGFSEFSDVDDALQIKHACAPIRRAFGKAGLAYSPAILEGMYSEWLGQLGAGDTLKLTQVGEPQVPVDIITFRLSA